MGNAYDLGDVVRVRADFKKIDGNPGDPATVVVRVRDPAGLVSQPSVVKDSTGSYHADFAPGVAGHWKYDYAGTGGEVTAAGSGWFVVRKSQIS